MTIPSRPAPPPPNQQQQQQLQRQNGAEHDNTSQTIIKLPPPPTSNTSVNVYHLKYGKTINQNSSTSTISSLSSSSSITRKFPSAKTRYAPIQNITCDDPFEMIEKAVENSNSKKKIPPPRPPPPKQNLSNNYGAVGTVLKKPGPPQSVSKLSNIFGKKKNNYNNKPLVKQQQFPPNKLPPLSSNTGGVIKSNYHQQQNYQSRPYAFVPPLIRNNNDSELISFDSPPNSPILKKSNSDCLSMDSFSSESNFSSPNNGSVVSQSESGFEDDFTSPPPDPWEQLIVGNTGGNAWIKDNKNSSSSVSLQLITTQPVRNLNTINSLKGDDLLSNGKSLLPPPPTLHMPTIIKPKTTTTTSAIQQLSKKNPAPKPPTLTTTFIKGDDNESSVFDDNDDNSPPMPNCPPPPPPPSSFQEFSESIDNYDDIDPSAQSYGIALYDFEGVEDGDLPFNENEKIYILQKLNDNWYFGRNKRGCEGIFPSNYVDIKVPLKINEDQTAASCAVSSSSSITNNDQKINRKAKSLYNFTAEVYEDLSLNENDIVTVLYQINDDWLYGEIGDRRGQFPANFIEFI